MHRIVYIVFLDEKPNTATVFSTKNGAIHYMEECWHNLMRNYQFTKYESKSASEGFEKSKHQAYSARDLDGHVHSARILETIVFEE